MANNKKPFIERVGEKHETYQGYVIEIIDYTNTKNATIRFSDGKIQRNVRYCHIKNGQIKNHFHPSTCGVGYLGYEDNKSKINKKQSIAYTLWRSMIYRCYDPINLEKSPSYINCSVDEKWHNFQNFSNWFDKNYNKDFMHGWNLDKDILVFGNRIYSENTCCLVPTEINNCFVKYNTEKLNMLPKGVYLDKNSGKYRTECNVNGTIKNLGRYDTKEEAFAVYKNHKELRIRKLAEKYRGKISEQCYNKLINFEIN